MNADLKGYTCLTNWPVLLTSSKEFCAFFSMMLLVSFFATKQRSQEICSPDMIFMAEGSASLLPLNFFSQSALALRVG